MAKNVAIANPASEIEGRLSCKASWYYAASNFIIDS